jgi:hypothetical protein
MGNSNAILEEIRDELKKVNAKLEALIILNGEAEETEDEGEKDEETEDSEKIEYLGE